MQVSEIECQSSSELGMRRSSLRVSSFRLGAKKGLTVSS